MREISKLSQNYYRLFIFHSADESVSVPVIWNKSKIESKSNTVGIFHNAAGEMNVHLLYDELSIFHGPIDMKDLNESLTSSGKVLDSVFGKREQMRKIGVSDPNIYCPKLAVFLNPFDYHDRMLRKYFFGQLKMDYFFKWEITSALLKPVHISSQFLHVFIVICFGILKRSKS